MADSTSLFLRTKISANEDELKKKTHDDDDDGYMDFISTKSIAKDYVKIIVINMLLITSVIMYHYEPPPKATVSSSITVNPVLTNTSQAVNSEIVDDNPFGFHPFYHVHKRIQYKNPPSHPCTNMNPKKTILIAILSRASNVHIREAIRLTWGSPRSYHGIEVRLSFLVGVDDGMIKQIELEQQLYHGRLFFRNGSFLLKSQYKFVFFIRYNTSKLTRKLSNCIL